MGEILSMSGIKTEEVPQTPYGAEGPVAKEEPSGDEPKKEAQVDLSNIPWILETHLKIDEDKIPENKIDEYLVKHIVVMGNLISKCGGHVETYLVTQAMSLDVAGASVEEPGPIAPDGIYIRVQFIIKGKKDEVLERIIPSIERKLYADIYHVVMFGAPQAQAQPEDSPNQTKLFKEGETDENI